MRNSSLYAVDPQGGKAVSRGCCQEEAGDREFYSCNMGPLIREAKSRPTSSTSPGSPSWGVRGRTAAP